MTPERHLPWLPVQGTSVLLVSGSPATQGEVARVCAAAAVGLVMVDSVEQVAESWDLAAAILIGSDARGGLAGWRGPTIVVGPESEAGKMWRQASLLGADRVAVLPESAQWLANHLTRLRDPQASAKVVGLLGGCGGAGTSTLAALLAVGSAARGMRTLLVDGDAWGGGLDLALGMRDVPGLRWPDLMHAAGAINPEQLTASLPGAGGISLLSWGAGTTRGAPEGSPESAASEVFRASREAFDLVVVDLARPAGDGTVLAGHCDAYIVVVPARVRAAQAAGLLAGELPAAPVGVVVRGPLAEGVDARMVADAVGHACLGSYPSLRRLREVPASGRMGDAVRTRRIRMLLDGILRWLDGDAGAGRGGPRRDGPR